MNKYSSLIRKQKVQFEAGELETEPHKRFVLLLFCSGFFNLLKERVFFFCFIINSFRLLAALILLLCMLQIGGSREA